MDGTSLCLIVLTFCQAASSAGETTSAAADSATVQLVSDSGESFISLPETPFNSSLTASELPSGLSFLEQTAGEALLAPPPFEDAQPTYVDEFPPLELNIPPTPELDLPGGSELAPESTSPAVPDLSVSPHGHRGSGKEMPIDIRPPSVADIEVVKTDTELNWKHFVIDDHGFLYDDVRDDLEILIQDRGGFGMTSIGTKFQAFSVKDGPLWGEVKFDWHFLSGPFQPDVKPRLYDLQLAFNYAEQMNNIWGIHLTIAPTWSGDWDNKTGDAFRIIGGGLLTNQLTPTMKLIGGAMYLDRPDVPVLPIGGVQLKPNDVVQLDLVFPRPRVAYRTSEKDSEEHWFYVAGEFGGGSWAVEREQQRKDRMSYRDMRLLIGFETAKIDGSRHVLEAGYVFNRELEFDRFGGSRGLGETAVIRWGSTY